MLSAHTHALIEDLARILEVIGVGVIIGGALLAGIVFLWALKQKADWRKAYEQLRADLGRGKAAQ